MLEHLKTSLMLQSQANFRVIGVLAETALALLLYISSFRAMPKCPELSVLVRVLSGERCENMTKMWKYGTSASCIGFDAFYQKLGVSDAI